MDIKLDSIVVSVTDIHIDLHVYYLSCQNMFVFLKLRSW